jgi:hypothetical protein
VEDMTLLYKLFQRLNPKTAERVKHELIELMSNSKGHGVLQMLIGLAKKVAHLL